MAGNKTGHGWKYRMVNGLAASVLFHLLILVLLGGAAMHLHQDQASETVYDVALMGTADIESVQAPGSSAHSAAQDQMHPPKQHEPSGKMPPSETPAAKPSASAAENDSVKEHSDEKRKQVAEDTGTGNARMSTGDATASTGDASASTGDATASTGDVSASAGDATAGTEDASASAGDATTSTGDAGTGIPPASDDIEAPAVPPRVLSSRAPEYPPSAQSRGTEGAVVIRFLLDKTGSVDDMEIVESSGSNALDRAARNAAAGFSFSPGLDSYGRPVRCYVYQTFTFRLE